MRKKFNKSVGIDAGRRGESASNRVIDDVKASDLFCKIGSLLYDRFQKEGVIDETMKKVRRREELRGGQWGRTRERTTKFPGLRRW